MKALVPMDSLGVFADTQDTARASSLVVAKTFNKIHKNVLRDIENLACSEEFHRLNFEPISYKDEYGRKQRASAISRDGFTFLVMGYRGKKSAQFKEAYIKRFNEMEEAIKTLVGMRGDFPLLTESIMLINDDARPYHFSNECDMLNRLVTGMTARQFRQLHDISKGESIRPYLSDSQIKLMDALQKADIGLLIAFPGFEQRKRHLESYRDQIIRKQRLWTDPEPLINNL